MHSSPQEKQISPISGNESSAKGLISSDGTLPRLITHVNNNYNNNNNSWKCYLIQSDRFIIFFIILHYPRTDFCSSRYVLVFILRTWWLSIKFHGFPLVEPIITRIIATCRSCNSLTSSTQAIYFSICSRCFAGCYDGIKICTINILRLVISLRNNAWAVMIYETNGLNTSLECISRGVSCNLSWST